jgi:hypothetical protein
MPQLYHLRITNFCHGFIAYYSFILAHASEINDLF